MEPRTSWDMLAQSRQRPACLSTGCPHLDSALGGGIRTGITERACWFFVHCLSHHILLLAASFGTLMYETTHFQCLMHFTVSGESASGKTQLVMQLLLQVQLPAEARPRLHESITLVQSK